tara:strand:- start:45 stop:371 length:327 start_codon:yes stop_codon:yes gene_type:complete
MKNNYWYGTGTHEKLSSELDELLPIAGSVDNPKQNPKLERYRKMNNAYHDLYCNGGGNPSSKTAYYFPKTITHARYDDWESCYAITEPLMDKAIILASKEQGLIKEKV